MTAFGCGRSDGIPRVDRRSPPIFGRVAEASTSQNKMVNQENIYTIATAAQIDYLGRADRMGLVAPEHAADLVVLDVDPRADVGNLHRTAGLVRAGVYWPAAELDVLKSRVAGSGRKILA